MEHLRDCKICGDEFDLKSALKRKAGGKIDECPECSRETQNKAFAVTNISREDDKETAVKIIQPAKTVDFDLYNEVMKVLPAGIQVISIEDDAIFFIYDEKEVKGK